MKKLFIVGALALVFPFISHASNLTACAPGDLFNVFTGASCSAPSVPQVCAPGDKFNSQTGSPCGNINTTPNQNLNQVDPIQAQVQVLQQEIITLKKEYYSQILDVESDRNYSSSIAQGRVNQLTTTLNQKIEALDFQIQNIELNGVTTAPVTTSSGGSVTPPTTTPTNPVLAPVVSIENDPTTPPSATLEVTDKSNQMSLLVPVLTFDINAQNQTVHIHQITVNINASGSGSITAAYLYQGTTQVSSAAVFNGSATFANITDATSGGMVYNGGVPTPYTVKVDATGLIPTSSVQVSASVGSNQTIYDSNDNVVTNLTGSASGNTITITN